VLYATSDPEGRFRIDGVTPGRHSIDATADHLAMERCGSRWLQKPARRRTRWTCTLVGTFAVSGTVIEQGTNAPIAGEVVRASGNEHVFEATTQADGSFTIDQATAGTYQLDVVAYPLPKRPTITVAKAEVHGVRVEVESSGSISGRVLRDGKPVDGVDVDAAYARAVTDHDGPLHIAWFARRKLYDQCRITTARRIHEHEVDHARKR